MPQTLARHGVRSIVTRSVVLSMVLAGCQSPVGIDVGPRQWDVLLRLPPRDMFSLSASPDGALFVSTFSGEVYRALPGHDAAWTRIVPPGGPILQTLFAPSAHTFFAISGSHTLRWDEGAGLVDGHNPLSDSAVFCGDFIGGIELNDVWGRNDHDVFAVGGHGVILHYDGHAWSVVPNVLNAAAPSLCYDSYNTDLYAVGGDTSQVYAAGYSVIRKVGNGGWETVSRPSGPNLGGALYGIAAQDGAVLIAGGDFERFGNYPNYTFADPARLFRVTATSWESLLDANPPVFYFAGGSALPGESAVFWGYDGGIGVVTGQAVHLLRTEAFGIQLRGAVAVGHSIYLAGNVPYDSAVVARLKP